MEIPDDYFNKQISISRWASITIPYIQTTNCPLSESTLIILSHTHIVGDDKA